MWRNPKARDAVDCRETDRGDVREEIAQGSFRDNTAIRAQVPGRPSLTRSPLGGKKAAFGVLRGEWAGGS